MLPDRASVKVRAVPSCTSRQDMFPAGHGPERAATEGKATWLERITQTELDQARRNRGGIDDAKLCPARIKRPIINGRVWRNRELCMVEEIKKFCAYLKGLTLGDVRQLRHLEIEIQLVRPPRDPHACIPETKGPIGTNYGRRA